MTNHPNRAKRRHGHLPGHMRDAFLEAIEAFEEWSSHSGTRPDRVGYQIRYRDRTISVAEACGLMWDCTDILPGDIARSLEDSGLTFQSQTYAAAARTMLAELKAEDGVNAGADAQLKRLYDERDRMWDKIELAIAAQRGYSPDRLSSEQRWEVAAMATAAVDAWEDRDRAPVPSGPFECLAQQLHKHCEVIAAIEEGV